MQRDFNHPKASVLMTLLADSKIINVYQGMKYWKVHSVSCYLENSVFQVNLSDKQITFNDIYQDLTAQSLFLDDLNQI